MKHNQPCLPPPEPLRGREQGTWAHDTVVNRLPEIARRVLAENQLDEAASGALENLIADIPDGPIRPLTDRWAPDGAAWADYMTLYVGQNWLEPPWFFIETYFYRRIMSATGYLLPGRGEGIDPFAYQKQQGLRATAATADELAGQIEQWRQQDDSPALLNRLLSLSLWGNQADLSLWPAGTTGPADPGSGGRSASLLLDDSQAVFADLLNQAQDHPQIDFILDNAAFELVTDLYLIDFLLSNGVAARIRLHLKAHPTFVSDAIGDDIYQTVSFLAEREAPATQKTGQRLRDYLNNGRLAVKKHFFWNSPNPMWEMPADLQQQLAQSALLVSKGDANYRRLLGDRHWPFTTPFSDIVCYLPAPLVALRTFKSEVAAGLSAGQPDRLTAHDPDWLTNGRWGVVQYAAGS